MDFLISVRPPPVGERRWSATLRVPIAWLRLLPEVVTESADGTAAIVAYGTDAADAMRSLWTTFGCSVLAAMGPDPAEGGLMSKLTEAQAALVAASDHEGSLPEEARMWKRRAIIALAEDLGLNQREREVISQFCVRAEHAGADYESVHGGGRAGGLSPALEAVFDQLAASPEDT